MKVNVQGSFLDLLAKSSLKIFASGGPSFMNKECKRRFHTALLSTLPHIGQTNQVRWLACAIQGSIGVVQGGSEGE